MASWIDIEKALNPSQEALALAEAITLELADGIPIGRTQSSLLRMDDAAAAAFFAGLERARGAGGRAVPVRDAGDSSWLAASDLCWFNVRACAVDGRPGSWLDAAKLLPAIASDAILLAPFHPNQFDLLYAPESMTILDEGLSDPRLVSAGFSGENQLRAFVSACRLLGKRVGYELLPYAAQFSRIAMERPELFRWVALDDARSGLAEADPENPYLSADRLRDSGQVADMVMTAKEEYGVSSFRKLESDPPERKAAKDKAYYAAIRLCIDRGLWPVPAHARAGVGIPSFLRYDGAGDFPVFTYRDADELDIGADAYGVVAPFAFYDGIPPNKAPSGPVPRNDQAIDYYSKVFSLWRDEFGFDFARFNAVDRVFDEAVDEEGLVPASDRPTPEVVAIAIRECRRDAPGIGAIAARKGPEIRRYAELGFDLTMGNEALRRVDAPMVGDALALYDELASGDGRRSVCFAVDLPEAGAPRLWGSSLLKVMGRERTALRHALARFLSVGKGRRPMFETMGYQDGSTGLYEAGLSTKGLDWADSTDFARAYVAVERLYSSLRPFIDSAEIAERAVEPGYAWWQIKGKGRDRLVVAVAALETAEGAPPGKIKIPIDPSWGYLEGTAFRLPLLEGAPISATEWLELELGFLEFAIVDLSAAFY